MAKVEEKKESYVMPADKVDEGEDVKFTLEPLDLHEKEFPAYMRDYFKMID